MPASPFATQTIVFSSRVHRFLPQVLLALSVVACGGAGDGVADSAGGHATARALALASNAQWSPAESLTLSPAGAANLSNGKVVLWAADGQMTFGGGTQSYTTVFDPASPKARFTDRLQTEALTNLFCPGTTNLPDGRLLVNGGTQNKASTLYDPNTNRWTSGSPMTLDRGYNGNTLLYNGAVLTLGGSWGSTVGGRSAEVWSSKAGWTSLSAVDASNMVDISNGRVTDPEGMYRADNHMWLFSAGNGQVFHAGPSAQMNWINTTGGGRVNPVGRRGNDAYSMGGTAVMFDTGKILKTGGAPSYGSGDQTNLNNKPATANSYVIDITGANVVTTQVASMKYTRAMHNSVVLPNGQVVVIGGQDVPDPFYDNGSRMKPELYDPASNTFTDLPEMTTPRNYHSVALLLPDATVLTAGGQLGSGNRNVHTDVQILKPGYLFSDSKGTLATRPVINMAPSNANYGSKINVTTDSAVTSFVLVRQSSVTHSVNNDQRRLTLSATKLTDTSYSVDIPSNRGWTLPGFYMLFALNKDGVPSVATTLQINHTNNAVIAPLDNTGGFVGTAVSVPVAVSNTDGSVLTYSATGLPNGVSINPTTGLMTGTPTTAGVSWSQVSVSTSAYTVSTNFTWTIAPASDSAGTRFRYFKFTALSEVGGNPWASMAELNVLDANGNAINRSAWLAYADSAELSAAFTPIANLFDGRTDTFWHTQWGGGASTPMAHWVSVDMGQTNTISAFTTMARQDGVANGTVAQFEFVGSSDGVNWVRMAAGDLRDYPSVSNVKTVSVGNNYRYVKLQALSEVNGSNWSSMAEFNVLDAQGNKLNRSAWTATVDSQELTAANNAAALALDGDANTLWHTQWFAASPPPAHWFMVDMKVAQTITGFTYQRRPSGNANGNIAKFIFWGSRDGVSWSPLVKGSMADFATTGVTTTVPLMPSSSKVSFAQYVRLTALSEVNGGPWTTMAEFNVLDAQGRALDRTGWLATADSQETTYENGVVSLAIDGNKDTFWHTKYSGPLDPMPHRFTVNMGSLQVLSGFTYLPRPTNSLNGGIGNFTLEVSYDGVHWQPFSKGNMADFPVADRVTTVLRNSPAASLMSPVIY